MDIFWIRQAYLIMLAVTIGTTLVYTILDYKQQRKKEREQQEKQEKRQKFKK